MASNDGHVLASPMRHDGGGFGGMASRGGGPASMSARSMPMKDRIVGRSITIVKGPYK